MVSDQGDAASLYDSSVIGQQDSGELADVGEAEPPLSLVGL